MKVIGFTSLSAIGRVLIAILLAAPVSTSARELAITNVQPSAALVDPARDENVRFRFTLTEPAATRLEIYDGRELLIRAISSEKPLSAGEHTLIWNLRDQSGRRVPPEAYTYVLTATANDGRAARFDLADLTGGATVSPRDVKWDATTKRLSYVLERPARVNVRLGLKEGGPLLRTLLDWVVRPAGLQEEAWDGKDAAGVLDLSAHPKLSIGVQAFSLADNVIVVGPSQMKVELIAGLPAQSSRIKAAAAPKRMYSHAQQPLAERGDFEINLVLPNTLPRSKSGVPIISSPVPVRLEIDQRDRERALARRFEPVFFVDGQFAFENEVGFVPMTWNFDPAALNEGEHYLTVNLRGYEGNFGMSTVKVLVRRAANASIERVEEQ